jgi:hypothetical protein
VVVEVMGVVAILYPLMQDGGYFCPIVWVR